MKAWHVRFLYFVVSNAAVHFVTPLEEELARSVFGEFPGGTLTHALATRGGFDQ